MMKRTEYRMFHAILTVSLLAGSFLLAKPMPIVGRVKLVETVNTLPEVHIANNRLELTFLPDSMGRISQIRHRAKQKELLQPYIQKILHGNPLFAPSTSNICGIREMFWGIKMTGSDIPVRLVRQSENQIEFDSLHYGNTAFGLQRKVHLVPDSMLLEFSLKLRNNSSAAATYSLWFNLTPVLPIHTMLPIKGGAQPVRGRGLQKLADEDTLFAGKQGQYFYAPAAPWAAARLESVGLLMVICFDMKELQPDGFFYSWGGITSSGEMRTFEPIFGSRELAPGDVCEHQYRILFLPEMEALRGMIGNTGINASFSNTELQLEFAAPVATAGQSVAVNLKNATETISLGNIRIPDLVPEKTEKLSLRLPNSIATGRYRVQLSTDAETIELIGAVLER
ncbi:MAG: hypothetical protein GX574_01920 [Lentisphaerae bacterium]|nr:hypothetical protein [Lentisphaerota bacterium]OQC14736.1 MAG: hypothetical protein BWX73_01665 [Lentisphaerae bacterium ADurb.Bin082]